MRSHPGLLVRERLLECIKEVETPTYVFIMRRFREKHGPDDVETADGILRNMVSNGVLLVGVGGHLILPNRSGDIMP